MSLFSIQLVNIYYEFLLKQFELFGVLEGRSLGLLLEQLTVGSLGTLWVEFKDSSLIVLIIGQSKSFSKSLKRVIDGEVEGEIWLGKEIGSQLNGGEMSLFDMVI